MIARTVPARNACNAFHKSSIGRFMKPLRRKTRFSACSRRLDRHTGLPPGIRSYLIINHEMALFFLTAAAGYAAGRSGRFFRGLFTSLAVLFGRVAAQEIALSTFGRGKCIVVQPGVQLFQFFHVAYLPPHCRALSYPGACKAISLTVALLFVRVHDKEPDGKILFPPGMAALFVNGFPPGP